jgi:hypothetical protein
VPALAAGRTAAETSDTCGDASAQVKRGIWLYDPHHRPLAVPFDFPDHIPKFRPQRRRTLRPGAPHQLVGAYDRRWRWFEAIGFSAASDGELPSGEQKLTPEFALLPPNQSIRGRSPCAGPAMATR